MRFLAILVLALLPGCASSEAARTLVAASNMMHPPFSSWDADGQAVGIEVDIVEEAARELGFQVQWVERPFSELLTAIENGEIDIAVSTIGITDQRKKRVAFSEPYHETQIVALVRKADSSPTKLSDLADSTIGADEATTSHPAARRQWPSARFIGRVREGMTWPQMVDRQLIDAFVVDASDQERLESASGIALARIEQPLSAEFFGVAMSRGEEDLQAAVNRAIEVVLGAGK
jgi:polar amino acid transport system substrate-binding protein